MRAIKVNGMHCANCKNAVEKAVAAIPGINEARVDLDKKELLYGEDDSKPVALDIILDAIRDTGFDPVDPRS